MTDTFYLIQYVGLNLFLLLVFFLIGRNISKGGNYWKNAIWAILFFVLIFGSRYARGNDYFHYVDVYIYDLEPTQRLFTWFNDFLKWLGVGPHYIFFVYAIPFVTSAMVLMEPMKKYAAWMFPLFIVANTMFEEYVIRQALSYSFVYLFMWELVFHDEHKMRKKVPFLLLYFACATSIHSANSLIMVLFATLYLFVRKPVSILITVPLYIFFSYIFPTLFDINNVAPIFNFLSDTGDAKFEAYNETIGFWTNTEREGAEGYLRKPIIKFLESYGNIALIILGTKLFKENKDLCKNYLAFFNLYIIGTYLGKAFMTLEIFRRMGDIMMYTWFVPLGLVMYYFNFKKEKIIYKIVSFGLVFWAWDYYRLMFKKGEMIHFMWDVINY